MNAQHSKATADWGTPHEVVQLARDVMGGIDCDPCSSEYWNEHLLPNVPFYSERASSLDTPSERWARMKMRRFFVNPPGGLVKEFWSFAVDRWQQGSAVFWVGFSLNQMTYLGKRGLFAPELVRAVPFRRLRYLQRSTEDWKVPVPGDAPPHGSYLALMPSSHDQVERFRELAPKLPGGAAVF